MKPITIVLDFYEAKLTHSIIRRRLNKIQRRKSKVSFVPEPGKRDIGLVIIKAFQSILEKLKVEPTATVILGFQDARSIRGVIRQQLKQVKQKKSKSSFVPEPGKRDLNLVTIDTLQGVLDKLDKSNNEAGNPLLQSNELI
jgi:hypothetical protein